MPSTFIQYPRSTTLWFSGGLDDEAALEAWRACELAAEKFEPRVFGPHFTVDLTEVSVIDQRCIRVLESLASDILEAGGVVEFVAAQGPVHARLSSYRLRPAIRLRHEAEPILESRALAGR